MSKTYTDLQGFYGSDGTRTRDLRRDRPVLPLPGWPGSGGDYPRQWAFRQGPCGDCRASAGASVSSCGICAGCVVAITVNERDAYGNAVASLGRRLEIRTT